MRSTVDEIGGSRVSSQEDDGEDRKTVNQFVMCIT